MKIMQADKTDSQTLVRLENRWLSVELFPQGGGKVTSIYNKALNYEFLWKNEHLSLQAYPAGTEYDPVFYGGVDELLPNDIPETVDGLKLPDHGELWTTPLQFQQETDKIILTGILPETGLNYQKIVYLNEEAPLVHTDYLIRNETNKPRTFLWKLHAALKIGEGDRIACNARKGQVVDPEYSRFRQSEPFSWPIIEQTDVSRIPGRNNTMDFFYLYDLEKGEVSWKSANEKYLFGYTFDTEIFPYVWLFASYGGFLNHYTAILEPCTSMPLSVNDAAGLGQCTVLQPGEEIRTTVTIYAGNGQA